MRDRLCKMLGIDIPIVLAPMGGAVAPRLAAAVSNAGALGTLPLWRAEIKTLRSAVQKTRALTAKPFAVNLNMEFPQEERLEACLEEKVPVISFFWRDPGDLVKRAKAGGAVVMYTVGNAEKQSAPSISASISSSRRAGKPVAMSGGRWRPCRWCRPSSMRSVARR